MGKRFMRAGTDNKGVFYGCSDMAFEALGTSCGNLGKDNGISAEA